MLESRSIPSGAASPGPTAPGWPCQARWPSNLARSRRGSSLTRADSHHRKLRQEGSSPWPDGSLARARQVAGLHPSGAQPWAEKFSRAPARLQTPFQRHHLVARVRHRPGDRPRSTGATGRVPGRLEVPAPGVRKEQFPGVFSRHPAVVAAPADGSGRGPCAAWKHRTADLLYRGRFFGTQAIIPCSSRSTPLPLSSRR